MQSGNMICSEHNGISLFLCILYIAFGIFMLLVGINTTRDQMVKMVLTMFFLACIGGATYFFMRFNNKKLILSGSEIICINSLGKERTYTLNRIKKVKIDNSVSGRHVKIIFDDKYTYIVNGSATNYYELESIAKKEWQ